MKENLKKGVIVKFETGETECCNTSEELFNSCFKAGNTKKMQEIKFLDVKSFHFFYNIILNRIESVLHGKYEFDNITFSKLKTIDCDISIVKNEEYKVKRIFTDWPITEFIISDVDNEEGARKEIKNELFNSDLFGKNNLQKIIISDSVTELGNKFFPSSITGIQGTFNTPCFVILVAHFI